MLSLRAHVAISVGIFALAMVGNALEASATIAATPGVKLAAMIAFGSLAAGLAFSAVPAAIVDGAFD